jgi:hypothetical protein
MASVRGLELFGHHFRDFRDRYVLIGGVASALAMEDAGDSFRATKDLDIVLVVEALDAGFVAHFWAFIDAGGYQIRLKGGEKPCFYRFDKPTDEAYPAQIELFSRAPDGLDHEENATLIPIPTDETVSSLSAILLDDAYYRLLLSGRLENGELSYIGADRLIPFKVKAWLDLSERKKNGEQVESKHIRKHRNDVLALTGLLDGEVTELPESIMADMKLFLELLPAEDVDFKQLNLKTNMATIIDRLGESFGLTTA